MRQVILSSKASHLQGKSQSFEGRFQAFLLPGLKPPLNRLEHSVMTAPNFSKGAEACAEFFLTENTISLESIFNQLVSYSGPPRWREKFLISLLHCEESPLQTAKRSCHLRFLKLLYTRKNVQNEYLSPAALEYMNWLYTHYSVKNVTDLSKFSKILEWLICTLARGKSPSPNHLKTLINFFDAETFAIQYLCQEILDQLDIDNPSLEQDFLLPLTLLEKCAFETEKVNDLLKKQAHLPVVGKWSFPMKTGIPYFKHWVRTLKKIPGADELLQCLRLQDQKRIPLLNLIPLISLCYWKADYEGSDIPPTQAIIRAMEVYHNGKFAIDINPNIMRTEYVNTSHSLLYKNGTLSGDMNREVFFSWFGLDLFPLHLHSQNQNLGVDVRDLIKMNIFRNSLLEKLLKFPRVYQTKGSVEYIAHYSNSVKILSKLASTPYLHSGPINQKVPGALLRNPAPIPLHLLRRFINTAHFSLKELRQIAEACKKSRPELFEEIQKYLSLNQFS